MKFLMMFFILMNLAVAAEITQVKILKEMYSKKAFEVKVAEENALMKLFGKKNSSKAADAESCIEWVYRGPATREQAVEACRGVHGTECVEWVYRGPASRIEAAHACRGVTDMSCVEFVYQGSASRVQAAQSCGREERPDCK